MLQQKKNHASYFPVYVLLAILSCFQRLKFFFFFFQFLGWEGPLEWEMAILSSIIAWKTIDRGPWWATVHEVAESDMTE